MSRVPVTVRNATDSFVRENLPARNFGNATRLVIRSNASGQTLRSFIHFPRPFPRGVTILSAKLRIYAKDNMPGTRTLTLRRVSEKWNVSRINWNNQPDVLLSDSKTLNHGGPAGTAWEFDVKSHMQAVADGAAWYGWRIDSGEDTRRVFYSAQSINRYKPVLEIEYTERPDKPTNLSPAEGVVSEPQPTLRFGFHDTGGSTELRAVRVQFGTSEDVANSLVYDSGEVITDAPELDLGAVTNTLTGMLYSIPSTAVYWRVSVQDEAGLWSLWSDSVETSYVGKGALTMNSPSGNIIEDTTPPIIWTLTGAVQSQWKVIVQNSRGKNIHTSGKRTNGETSYTIPKGVIREADGQTYTLILRVWDDVNRESTPGEPNWHFVRKTITYNDDPTVDPVTNLTATALSPDPGVSLTWDRSVAGDAWVIWRKTAPSNQYKVIERIDDPADALISGTTYGYVDRTATPHRANTYMVAPVVNNKQNRGAAPSVSATPKPVGIWLIDPDPDRPISVQLLGQDGGTWAMGEDAGMFAPLGADSQRRITQSLRGYEGSISGLIIGNDSRSVALQEKDVFEMKETPSKTYVLVLSNMAIPVVIGNVSVAPTPRAEIEKAVAFEFWQVDELPFEAVV